jgi:hypothetical protein
VHVPPAVLSFALQVRCKVVSDEGVVLSHFCSVMLDVGLLTADYYLHLLQYELLHLVEDVQLQARYSIMYAEVLTLSVRESLR